MKLSIAIFVMMLLLSNSAEAQKRKTKPAARKPAATQKKAPVKKTARTQAKPAPAKVVSTARRAVSNEAQVWPRCTAGASHLTVSIYHQRIFTQAVRVTKDPEKNLGNWIPVSDGWNGLAQGAVLKALVDSLEPDEMQVYPAFSTSNSTIMNMVVFEKDRWVRRELEMLKSILKEYITGLGFQFSFTEWECILPESYEEQPTQPHRLRILQ